MKLKILIFCLCVMLIDVIKSVKTGDFKEWEDFKRKYHKHYATPKEEKQRMEIFKDNLKKIAKNNEKFDKGEVTFTMGINPFADMTAKEFKAKFIPSKTPIIPNKIARQQDGLIVTKLDPKWGTPPETKNWVAEGAVSPVKFQGWDCGSCWAFAAAGAIESHNFIKTKKMVRLSEQNLLDCVGTVYHGSMKYTNDCKGGLIFFALQYVKYNEGINTEDSYPYEAEKKQCRYSSHNIGAKIKDFKIPQAGDEELLKGIVGTLGPVTSVITADNELLYLYKEGIHESPTCGNPKTDLTSHSVLIVGYGKEGNQPYWLVKNSWGPEWGENGYFRIKRGSNECDIGSNNFFPII